MKSYSKSERNSNLELLKIIAIFIIVVSHVIPYNYTNSGAEYIDINVACLNLTTITLQFFRNLGQIGNLLFIICSSWFLLEKKHINIQKVISIVIDCFIVSVICLIIILFMKYEIPFNILIKQFMPTFFSNNWFIPCYLIFYLITPYLNIIIENLNEKKLKNLCITSSLFMILQLIRENTNIYNYLFGFIYIYFIIAYLKKYKDKIMENTRTNIVIFLVSIILIILFLVVYNFFGTKISMLSNSMLRFNNIKNPLFILVSISLFNLFKKLNFKNSVINFISSQTLLIYVIHDNYLFRELLRRDYYKYIFNTFGYKNICLICLISAFCTFIVSIAASSLYKLTLKRTINSILYRKKQL